MLQPTTGSSTGCAWPCSTIYYAELHNYPVLGCLNRSELLTGLFVKYGDGACDLAPILGLYKTQVRELAQHLGLPSSVVERPPSPDLIPGLTDAEILGLDYPVLDRILAGIDPGGKTAEVARRVGIPKERVEYPAELVKRSARMRAGPMAIYGGCPIYQALSDKKRPER